MLVLCSTYASLAGTRTGEHEQKGEAMSGRVRPLGPLSLIISELRRIYLDN
jgi:hypothetical protein